MFHAIAATLKHLLETELHNGDTEIDISFSQPNRDWSGRLSAPQTVNLFLYDVRENPHLRRHQWQQGLAHANGGARPQEAQVKRTPLMLDCFYLVTAWSRADEKARSLQEHDWLGRTLAALARYPILNPPFAEKKRAEAFSGVAFSDQGAQDVVLIEQMSRGHMVSEENAKRRAWLNDPAYNPLRDIEIEVRTRIAHHDVLTNPAEVWSALENEMKAGFSYVVTLPLDPWKTMPQSVDLVGLSRFDLYEVTPARDEEYAEQSSLPAPSAPHERAWAGSLYRLSGKLTDVAIEPTAPAQGVQVMIMEPELLTGSKRLGLLRRTLTDVQGRFSFQRLLPGEYIIVIGPDIEAPYATENVIIPARTSDSTHKHSFIPLEIEIELPDS